VTEATSQRTPEYPIDTVDLVKGSKIKAEVIEKAFGVMRTERDYSRISLDVCKHVERRFQARNEHVVVRMLHDDVVILTDEEAVSYTRNGVRNGVRSIIRKAHKQASIDQSKLSEVALKAHQRDLYVSGRTVEGMLKARRDAFLPHKVPDSHYPRHPSLTSGKK
jgi:hypothetical protein